MSTTGERTPPRRESLALTEAEARARLGERRFRLIKRWIEEVNGPYDALVAPYVTGSSTLLDAGCSRGDPDLPSVGRAGLSVGCDGDLAGLRGNTIDTARTLSSLDRLPFRDGRFDAVVCKFVVEHLEEPLTTFEEFARVLKPGGVVAVLTPNSASHFALLSRLVPYRLKRAMKGRLFGGYEEDTFPTRYRANRRGQLDSLMRRAGFRTVTLQPLAGMWTFFIFSTAMAMAVRGLERTQLKLPLLRNASTYLMGLWQKGQPAS